MLRTQAENLVKENAHLKTNMNELEGSVRKLTRENDHLQQELMKTQDIMIQSEDELNATNQNYANLKANTDQRISALAIDMERLRA
jgi:predicted RNase H-like nuclease (RuvC/YqgF family)